MTDVREHLVRVRAGQKFVDRWTSYSVNLDMLQPADRFDLTVGNVDADLFKTFAPDQAVEVLLDETTICTGFIDDRFPRSDRGGAVMSISGRDKGGRLCDESAPLTTFKGLGLTDLAKIVVAPWFSSVSLSNARNRQLLRGGGGRLAKASSEPILVGRAVQKKVNPGESRWQVLQHVLEEAELLGWSSADGKEFIIGQPNYAQETQFRFVAPGPGSAKRPEGNVKAWELRDSVGERYARVVACGSGQGDSSNYSDRVNKRRGDARNGPNADGTGKDFRFPKTLLVSDDDVRSQEAAEIRARREMAERDAGGRLLQLTVRGHSQVVGGKKPVFYTFDAMADVELEVIGIRGRFLITGVTFSVDRQGGGQTVLDLVPEGTVLRQ